MSRFMNSKYASLEAYTPGEQPRDMRYVKLNTNESPYPPSPEVIASVGEKDTELLRLYPDPTCHDLKRAIAEGYGTDERRVFISNGSDDILNSAFMAFAEKGAVFADITYGFYKVIADLNLTDVRIAPLREDLTIDPADYMDACGRLIVIANPNAPTGIELKKEEIRKIALGNPGSVVVIDEAYVDFGCESCFDLAMEFPNVLVVMTCSKSRSLAGARLGFAFGPEDLIADLETLKFSNDPYSINRLTMKAGIAAFSEGSQKYYKENCGKIAETREKAVRELKEMGFETTDSVSNFIFAKHPGISGQELYEKLKSNGVLVRHFTQDRICEYNRITVGSPAEMGTLLITVKKIIEGR